ncbi:hypothetical protein B0H19DRAFT_1074564 [Mycena capillaripes]|nr:hypothetical protein B0H19DRAFT_1074564 [Mycena capillaripes]
MEPINNNQTPTQMLETIQLLMARIDELERTTGQSPSEVLLYQPYLQESDSSRSQSPDLLSSPISQNIEPPPKLLAQFLDIFLERFTDTGYFFLNGQKLQTSARLTLPFERLSASLLNSVCLWACVLATTISNDPYTEEAFLSRALQNIVQDIADLSQNRQRVIEIIQAEVLLSYYYLHCGQPTEGRYHSATAVCLALNAGFHQLGSTQLQEPYPPFPLTETPLPPPADNGEATERASAFWGAWILNNYWVAVNGSPSAVPGGVTVEIPWPGSVETGATISRFLSGNEQTSFSPIALLAKASTLLERIVTFTSLRPGPPDLAVFTSFARRLQVFQSNLPPFPDGKMLLVASILTDIAILRLHAQYSRTSEANRTASLAAVARIVSNLSGVSVQEEIQPIIGALSGTVWSFYMNELLLSEGTHQYRELEVQLRKMMDIMSALAVTSPVTQHSLSIARQAYDSLSPSSM